MPRVPTCAAILAIAAASVQPVAADDHTRSVSTVTKPDAELDRTSPTTAVGDIGCIFPPDLSRIRREVTPKLLALVRRCALPTGATGTATILLDRSGRIRAPSLAADLTAQLAPATTACVISTLRTWRFSRRAAATVYTTGLWEPVPIDVEIAVP